MPRARVHCSPLTPPPSKPRRFGLFISIIESLKGVAWGLSLACGRMETSYLVEIGLGHVWAHYILTNSSPRHTRHFSKLTSPRAKPPRFGVISYMYLSVVNLYTILNKRKMTNARVRDGQLRARPIFGDGKTNPLCRNQLPLVGRLRATHSL